MNVLMVQVMPTTLRPIAKIVKEPMRYVLLFLLWLMCFPQLSAVENVKVFSEKHQSCQHHNLFANSPHFNQQDDATNDSQQRVFIYLLIPGDDPHNDAVTHALNTLLDEGWRITNTSAMGGNAGQLPGGMFASLIILERPLDQDHDVDDSGDYSENSARQL